MANWWLPVRNQVRVDEEILQAWKNKKYEAKAFSKSRPCSVHENDAVSTANSQAE